MLQQRFAIIRYPALSWLADTLWEVMNACVTLHNMILESGRGHPVDATPYLCEGTHVEIDHNLLADWTAFIGMHMEIRNGDIHDQLQNDLVELAWVLKGLART